MDIDTLFDDIVKALADIEKAELLLNTYDRWNRDDLYIEISHNFIISSRNRIMEVVGVLEKQKEIGGVN